MLVRLHPMAGHTSLSGSSLHNRTPGSGLWQGHGYGLTQHTSMSFTPSHTSQPVYPTFSVRHSRPCNVVAFSEAEPRWLATGLDRVRNDYCLAIWDVEQARSAMAPPPAASVGGMSRVGEAVEELPNESLRSGDASVWPPQATSQPALSDIRPIIQYGMSETVLSCAWFPRTPTQLVAGMAHKWLRVYDIRGKYMVIFVYR
jgi:hypothetical protein